MFPDGSRADVLRQRIARAEAELADLQRALAEETREPTETKSEKTDTTDTTDGNRPPAVWPWPLSEQEYERYARQLILPGVGVRGQRRLRDASVLVVGAGGLGCPAALYLASAGVGRIGIVDGDVVEPSNLHRQIGHTTARVGQPKAASLVASLRALNPLPAYTAHCTPLTPANAVALVAAYDVALDCTDRPATRYLVSDACVRAGRPLVSAAALRTDGQLAVLNWPVGRGPCYRCVFPRPPPPASQVSCAEGGVLGPVVGLLGVLQALEGLRILLDEAETTDTTDTTDTRATPTPTLLLVSAADAGRLAPPSFRTVRLRGRRADCFACSDDAPLQAMPSLAEGPDYVQFCGVEQATVQLAPDERVTVQDVGRLLRAQRPHWLLDVREKELFDMGSLDGAVNVPFSQIQAAVARQKRQPAPDTDGLPGWLPRGIDDDAPVYVVCRVGVNSQVVARQLQAVLGQDGRFVGDVKGGIWAWKQEMDSTIPFV